MQEKPGYVKTINKSKNQKNKIMHNHGKENRKKKASQPLIETKDQSEVLIVDVSPETLLNGWDG